SQESCAIELVFRNVKFANSVIDLAAGQFTADVSADIAPFAVVYTTNVNGPPMQFKDQKIDHVIMYPIQIGLLAPNAQIAGRIRADLKQKKLTGNVKVSCNGLLAVGTPRYAGIPVPRGDND